VGVGESGSVLVALVAGHGEGVAALDLHVQGVADRREGRGAPRARLHLDGPA
jgi:hypothetical protein